MSRATVRIHTIKGRTGDLLLRKAGVAAVAMLVAGAGVAMAVPPAGAAPAPPTVVTTAVTGVHPTSVTLTGTVDPHGVATTWYFEYGANTTLVSRTAATSAGTGDSTIKVSKTIAALSPATSYDYRIVATNSSGTTFGARGTFETSAAPIVVTGAASGVATYTATLNGTVNPEALATSWYFEYGLTTRYGSKTATQTLVPSQNTSTVSAGISGLVAQSSYYFRIVAKSSAGASYGSRLTLTTGLSVTLNTSTPITVYANQTTLFGTLASGAAGQQVVIKGMPFNQNAFSVVGSVTSGAGGQWSYPVAPLVRTTYEVTANGGSSSPISVSVRPAVSLSNIGHGKLMTQVIGQVSFADHVLQMQMLSHGLWVTWKYVRLNSSATATFSTRLPKGVRMVRMAIAPFVQGIDQAAPGYLAGYSSPVVHRR